LGLHKGMFRQICEIAVKFYQSTFNDEAACRQMTTQLIDYKNNDYPFNFSYDFSKSPIQWWGVIEDKQNNILESCQFSNNEKLEIGSMIDLSNTSFGGQDVSEVRPIVQGSGNMDFDPIAVVESELR
ncbi:6684_t:CDS:2, partial [Racocetra fulgida]